MESKRTLLPTRDRLPTFAGAMPTNAVAFQAMQSRGGDRASKLAVVRTGG